MAVSKVDLLYMSSCKINGTVHIFFRIISQPLVLDCPSLVLHKPVRSDANFLCTNLRLVRDADLGHRSRYITKSEVRLGLAIKP